MATRRLSPPDSPRVNSSPIRLVATCHRQQRGQTGLGLLCKIDMGAIGFLEDTLPDFVQCLTLTGF